MPNTVSDWGREEWENEAVLVGEYGTRRYVYMREGRIIAAILIGRMTPQLPWQLLLMATEEGYRRRGIMRRLYQRVIKDVGPIKGADDYTAEGKAFARAVGIE